MDLSELLEEYLLELSIKGYSKTTIKGNKSNLTRFTEYLKTINVIVLLELKTIHIKQYISHMQSQGKKNSYINTSLKNIRSMLNYAVQEEYISKDISSKVKLLKEEQTIIETFNEQELKLMLDFYKHKDFLSSRNRLIVHLLADTGIRAHELTNISLKDIQDGSFLIHGKGNKQRLLPISPILQKELIKYLRYRNARKNIKNDYLLVSYYGKQLTVQTIEEVVKAMKHLVRNNIRVSPHTFRHTAAQMLLKQGIDTYVISKILGHTNINITKIYLNSLDSLEVAKLSISPISLLSR